MIAHVSAAPTGVASEKRIGGGAWERASTARTVGGGETVSARRSGGH